MAYKTLIDISTMFNDLKNPLMAKQPQLRSGDQLWCCMENATERCRTNGIGRCSIEAVLTEVLISHEQDEITRLIIDEQLQ
jgi:ethanolamine ammonia-lyase large subunit